MTMDHLSNDELSALIDGEGDAGAGAHLDACRACTARRDDLARAAAAVATSWAPPPALVDRWVERALAGGSRPPVRGADPLPRGSRRRWSLLTRAAWIGAAASLLVLVGVAVLVRDTGSDRSRNAAAPLAGTAGAARDSTSDAGALLPISADLGDQSDASALRALLSSTTPSASSPDGTERAASSTAVPGTPAGAPTTGPTDKGFSVTAPAGGATPSMARCVDAAAQAGAADVAEPVFAGVLRWRGDDAEVIVFRLARPAGSETREAIVMTRSGCEVLSVQRF